MRFQNIRGFTVLELVIVIIIVGILASLALPRFTRVIEKSRATEALVHLKVLREAIERCYLMGNGYGTCASRETGTREPSPNDHFSYTVISADADSYYINAQRNTLDGGNTSDSVSLSCDNGNFPNMINIGSTVIYGL